MYAISTIRENVVTNWGWHSYGSMLRFMREWQPRPGERLDVQFAKINVLPEETA